ncbi:MAG: hypothetical protein R3E01_33490 [Pirellulaceae bacterium]
MLQSFRGTVDVGGIRSLYLEADVPARPQLGSSLVAEFWAVLDAKELPVIREAVRVGDRRTALSLICERSAFIGSILPD